MRARRLAAKIRGVTVEELALSPMTNPLITKKMSTPLDPWLMNALWTQFGSATEKVRQKWLPTTIQAASARRVWTDARMVDSCFGAVPDPSFTRARSLPRDGLEDHIVADRHATGPNRRAVDAEARGALACDGAQDQWIALGRRR